MRHHSSIAAAAVMAAVLMTSLAAQAFDDAKYPDLSGQWVAVRLGVRGQPAFDPTKPWGLGQQAPLTPEYQKILEQSVADQAAGGQGIVETYACASPGMPRVINGYGQSEFVITPGTTHILVENIRDSRRIFTDGRPWPERVEPSLLGYSIGQWIDTDGDGKFDTLEVETRFLKGPRALDPAGMPTHADNNSIIKERLFVDKTDPSRLYNEITLIDNAFTRPWTVLKTYRRLPDKYPEWPEDRCDSEGMVKVGNETYFKSADGTIMPTSKDQPSPDLRYFESTAK